MSPRKKRGVGFFIGGAAFIIAAIVFFTTETTPTWFPTIVAIVGMIAEFFGFEVVFPDTG